MANGCTTFYEQGSWKFCCAICGRTDIKSSQALKSWKGFWPCHECYEMRNAQELVRPVPDKQYTPWVQRCGAAGCAAVNSPPTRVLDSMFLDELSLG